jgi:hypothetical protein
MDIYADSNTTPMHAWQLRDLIGSRTMMKYPGLKRERYRTHTYARARARALG